MVGLGCGSLGGRRGEPMPRKGHSEEKIVYTLRQVEAGKKVTEVYREMGVSPQAFYSGVAQAWMRNSNVVCSGRQQIRSAGNRAHVKARGVPFLIVESGVRAESRPEKVPSLASTGVQIVFR
jgi:hypothetical protein